MTMFIAAAALALASPAAAQPADQSQHRQHGQHQPGQHPEGERHQCPCCAPGADGRRPACCERMHQEHGRQSGQPQDHDHH